jgi:hypothetical protein
MGHRHTSVETTYNLGVIEMIEEEEVEPVENLTQESHMPEEPVAFEPVLSPLLSGEEMGREGWSYNMDLVNDFDASTFEKEEE